MGDASVHTERPQIVVVKLGGGLITTKEGAMAVRQAVLDRCAAEVLRAQRDTGCGMVIVHGAGSFGHHKAKVWRLAEGRWRGEGSPPGPDRDAAIQSQADAVTEVRNDMLNLSVAVARSFEEQFRGTHTRGAVQTARFPPHRWARGTGMTFEGSVDPLLSMALSTAQGKEGALVEIPITWGDVTSVDGPLGFGVLSGDDIVFRLAAGCPPDATVRVVFAISGADGVLRVPPEEATAEDLIEKWSDEQSFVGRHRHHHDVTGGIGLKVARAIAIAAASVDVTIVNGEVDGRLYAAVVGSQVRGTAFLGKRNRPSD